MFCSGVDLGFSRRGGQIFKIFFKILSNFYVDQNDFPSTPETLLKSYLNVIKIIIAFLGFLKNFDEKFAFFRPRAPLIN